MLGHVYAAGSADVSDVAGGAETIAVAVIEVDTFNATVSSSSIVTSSPTAKRVSVDEVIESFPATLKAANQAA